MALGLADSIRGARQGMVLLGERGGKGKLFSSLDISTSSLSNQAFID